MLPRREGTVTVLYTGYPGSVPAFMERDRNLWLQPLTAVPERPDSPAWMWRVLPNPVRAGRPLRLQGVSPGTGPARLEVFDVGGRLVASAEMRPNAGGWVAEIPGQTTREWASGIYFARLAGEGARARIVVLR